MFPRTKWNKKGTKKHVKQRPDICLDFFRYFGVHQRRQSTEPLISCRTKNTWVPKFLSSLCQLHNISSRSAPHKSRTFPLKTAYGIDECSSTEGAGDVAHTGTHGYFICKYIRGFCVFLRHSSFTCATLSVAGSSQHLELIMHSEAKGPSNGANR